MQIHGGRQPRVLAGARDTHSSQAHLHSPDPSSQAEPRARQGSDETTGLADKRSQPTLQADEGESGFRLSPLCGAGWVT